MTWIHYKIRWWYWFLTGPNEILSSLAGVSKPSRDIIFERWLEQEPKNG